MRLFIEEKVKMKNPVERTIVEFLIVGFLKNVLEVKDHSPSMF